MPERCEGFPLAMILDHDPVFRTALATHLLNCGAPVVGAASIREGIAALSHHPGYLVASLSLGDGSSVEVVKEARRRGMQFALVVLVAESTYKMDYMREMAVFQPDNSFMKPIAPQEVGDWMVQHFKKMRAF